jgi:hypothetical protein
LQEKESQKRKSKDDHLQKLKLENQQKLQQLNKVCQIRQKASQQAFQEKQDVERKMTEYLMEFVKQKERNFSLIE